MGRRIPYPGFVGGTYISQSKIAAQERTVNFYVEVPEPVATPKSRAFLYPTPGFARFDSGAAAGVGRGAFAYRSRAFAGIGGDLQELASNGSLTDRANIANLDTTPVTFAANGDGGDQLVITASDVLYAYDLTANTIGTVRASGNRMCGMLDGFIITLDAATSTVYVSELLNASTFPSFFQRSAAPDPYEALLVVGRQILMLGKETSEFWYNNGDSPMPFKVNLDIIPVGIAAPFSAAEIGGIAIWLARTANGEGFFVEMSGSSPRRISTHALEATLKTYTTLADAVSDTYSDEGHEFYVVTFPTANATWVYDLTTGIWCERGTWDSDNNRYDAWRPLHHIYQFGTHLWLDRSGEKVYRSSTSLTTEVSGTNIRRLRRCPAINDQHRRLFYSEFELLLESGLGVLNVTDPQVELRYANDGGKNFDNAGLQSAGQRAVGAEGEYLKRVRWTRLGSGRDRVFDLVMSDGIPWRLIDAYLTVG